MQLTQHTEDIAAAAVAGVVWVAAQAVTPGPFWESLAQGGVMAVLVGFFVVTGWKREARLYERIEHMDQENPKLLERTVTALENHADSNKSLAAAIEGMQRTVERLAQQYE